MRSLTARVTSERRPAHDRSLAVAVLLLLATLASGVYPAPAGAQDPEPGERSDSVDEQVIDVYFVAGQSNAYNLHVERFQPGIDEHVPDTDTVMTVAANGAHAATSLYKDWRAGGTAATTGDGSFYVRFQDIVHTTLADLRAANPDKTVRLAGVWWHQGEADAKYEQHALAYSERLHELIADMRITFDEPDLPFFLARIMLLNTTYWDVVRDQLVQVGREDPRVWTVDLDTVHDDLLYGFHYTADGYRELGARAAKTYAELVARPGDGCGTYLVDIEGCLLATHRVGCDVAVGAGSDPATTMVEVVLENRADVAVSASVTVDGEIQSDTTVGPRGVEVASSGPYMATDTVAVSVSAGPVLALETMIGAQGCSYVLHDVDDSGSFDAQDVGALLDHFVGASTPSAIERAYGGDQALDLSDALRLAKCLDGSQTCTYE